MHDRWKRNLFMPPQINHRRTPRHQCIFFMICKPVHFPWKCRAGFRENRIPIRQNQTAQFVFGKKWASMLLVQPDNPDSIFHTSISAEIFPTIFYISRYLIQRLAFNASRHRIRRKDFLPSAVRIRIHRNLPLLTAGNRTLAGNAAEFIIIIRTDFLSFCFHISSFLHMLVQYSPCNCIDNKKQTDHTRHQLTDHRIIQSSKKKGKIHYNQKHKRCHP